MIPIPRDAFAWVTKGCGAACKSIIPGPLPTAARPDRAAARPRRDVHRQEQLAPRAFDQPLLFVDVGLERPGAIQNTPEPGFSRWPKPRTRRAAAPSESKSTSRQSVIGRVNCVLGRALARIQHVIPGFLSPSVQVQPSPTWLPIPPSSALPPGLPPLILPGCLFPCPPGFSPRSLHETGIVDPGQLSPRLRKTIHVCEARHAQDRDHRDRRPA